MKFLFRISFIISFLTIAFFLLKLFLSPIFTSTSVIIPYGLTPFDICIKHPIAWEYIKIFYIFFFACSISIISNSIFNLFFRNVNFSKKEKVLFNCDSLNIYIGNNNLTNEKIYLPEKGLYQNLLITGTIGSGKTSSAMYPFTKQLIAYKCDDINKKLGMLILDVKGNFYKKVKEYSYLYNRKKDLIIIELGSNIKYNPLDKKYLKPTVLANRLKTILMLFSTNNSDSYWLDKVEQTLTEAIKLCRLYNNEYVTFEELHKIINDQNYLNSKLKNLKIAFQHNKLNEQKVYDLKTSIDFFKNEFFNLDPRISSIIKSEISRITGTFINDIDVLKTFCPKKSEISFNGFSDVIQNGKIVVLNMNIAQYKNLSKIIATYLKLDFQSEVIFNISKKRVKPCVFISDEFHEYITSSDSEFFAQSREGKCINIVATQSYSSILNTLKDSSATRAIIQNLVNKLWFRTDDTYTIEDAQKQLGKEEKTRISKSISENAKETKYDYFINSLKSVNSNISESISTYVQSDFIYSTNFFTQQLESFSCLGFLSNGSNIYPPCKINLIPYFKQDYIHNENKINNFQKKKKH